ncbi:rod shape-determining protein MreD [Clostridium putrefaciens]|uniref:Rod shape-determining protein MreD n=1 Tax=Clostridium putrefaciens TaxID=99675 RepID=A0A381JBJ5_9CLOT|nr:rod shape-determining protein MreD [Clostridium putrefaciens]SUY47767.1 rod shape-determining protein MreD [Clostridium putrefaciens]
MKRVILILISLLLFIIDNTFMPFLEVNGVYPSLLIIFALSYSIINGYYEAILIGVFAGLLQDIYFFNGFGINALSNMCICLIAAKIGENIFKEKSLAPIISIFMLSILKGGIIFVILFILNIKINYFNIPFVALYNMIITTFVYNKIYSFSAKPYMKNYKDF